MFWPEQHANKILKQRGKALVVETGITPSGPIHVGNLREVLTADFVVKAIGDRAKINFFLVIDDFDPLRKVYPFLDQSFSEHVGKPLFLIPCPGDCKDHESYADHFLTPFVDSLNQLNVDLAIKRASQLYQSGVYTKAITKVIEQRQKVRKILEDVSQRKLEADWFPFNPLCAKCQKLRAKVTEFDLAKTQVQYSCPDCGGRGVADFSKGEGKLAWRIDWACRWWIFKVNVEPFGKDHASPGGSYETGERIAKEVFDSPAPYPIIYERVHLRGEGAMHSSTGVAIEASEILKAVSPTLIRYFFARSQVDRHIEFDTGEGITQLYDDYRQLRTTDPVFNASTVEPLPNVPYRHIVMVYQAAAKKVDQLLNGLKRTGHSIKDKKTLERLLPKIEQWLSLYAPAQYRFEISQSLPAKVKQLSKEQKAYLKAVLALIEQKTDLSGEQLHSELHRLRKDLAIKPKVAFSSIYLIFLGKDSGPQAGWFLAAIDRSFVLKRLKEATAK